MAYKATGVQQAPRQSLSNTGTLRRSLLSLIPDILYWLETFKTAEPRAAHCLGWYFWWIMWECMCAAVIWVVCVRGNVTVWGCNAPRGAELCWWSWECWCDVSGMMTHSMRSARGLTHTHTHTHTHMHIHWYVQVLVVSHKHTSKHTHTATHTHTHTQLREYQGCTRKKPGETTSNITREQHQPHWRGCHSDKSNSSRTTTMNASRGCEEERDTLREKREREPRFLFSPSSVFVSRINWPLRNKDEVTVRGIIFVQTQVPRRHQRQTARLTCFWPGLS